MGKFNQMENAFFLRKRIILDSANVFPQDIVLESTTFCNLNCIMCSNRKITRGKGKMRWTLYRKILDEVALKAADKVRLWLCFYGEPLMDPDLLDRVILAKEKDIKNVVLNSNMNLMKEDLGIELVKAGLNTIFVGLDAASEEVYKKIRVNGNYNQVVKNILDYNDAIHKYGTKEQKIIVQFIDMPENHHQLERVKEFWHKYGITVKVRPLVTWQESSRIVAESGESSGSLIERLPCHWQQNILAVTFDGRVVYCGCDYDGRNICGDLNVTSIEELWSGIKKEHRRIQLLEKWDELPDFCRKCKDWKGAYAKYE